MRQQMILAASTPHQGLRYVRIHFLLDLVAGKGFELERPLYDWSRLDGALDFLHGLGFAPIFELMGNPSGWWTDFKDRSQADAWRRFIRDLARRYQERYGAATLRSWLFETWNEPDLPWWRHDVVSFLIYYDACSEGLREVDPSIPFGGPGTCETMHRYFTALMEHCDTGTNHFTGETGVRIDFISVHEKGGKWSDEQVSPHPGAAIAAERKAIEHLRAKHPRLLAKPFVNDECDPLIGWKQIQSFRGKPYYAAITCRFIDLHQRLAAEEAVEIPLISQDNGFLGSWGHRTLCKRFLGAGQGEDEHRRFELIKKPALTVLTLLAHLGERRVAATVTGGADEVGVFATRRDGQVAVLIYHHGDRVDRAGERPVRVELTGLGQQPLHLARWELSDGRGDPFRLWEDRNYPDHPDKDPKRAVWPDTPDIALYEALRRVQEPPLVDGPRCVAGDGGRLTVDLVLPRPGVTLLTLTPDPGVAPPAVGTPTWTTWPGLTRDEQILLRWPCTGHRALRGFEAEYRPQPTAPWESLPLGDLLATAWLHQRPVNPDGGQYRVRAVDLWERRGSWSPILSLPGAGYAGD
jgi:L-iduronidase